VDGALDLAPALEVDGELRRDRPRLGAIAHFQLHADASV